MWLTGSLIQFNMAAFLGERKGLVLCGDVGQNAYEELDILRKGANYGWRSREGLECYDEEMCGSIGE